MSKKGSEFLVLGRLFFVAKTKCRVNLRNPFSVAVSLLLRRMNLWFNFFYLFSVFSVPSVAEEFLVLGQKANLSVSNQSVSVSAKKVRVNQCLC